ncbi:MAG TPA: hypothetical protein VFE17_05275 [Candidatus Baltobacteraceae bacterium]|jgi:hypothetical protein|nr:hypothetical protein [Candidatus Baltobacteraceae bacterium]
MLKSALILAGLSVYLLLKQCTGSPPSVTPSASPSSVAPLPTPLVLAANAPPQILAVQMSDYVLHSGELVSGTVVTSTNVTAVEIRVGPRSGQLPQTAPGMFSISYRMPNVPFFLRGQYTAQIVARTATGASAERDITVRVAVRGPSLAPRAGAIAKQSR